MRTGLRWAGSLALALAAFLAVAQTALASGPELVTNGGFETPTVVNTASYDTYTATTVPGGFGWTVTGSSVDHIRGYWDAAAGSQSVDLDGVGPGGISQTLATTANQPYVLTFAYSANPDRQSIAPCTNTKTGASMNVTWGGQSIGSFTFSDPNSFRAMGWRTATVQVGAASTTSSSTVLAFTSTDAQSACGIALDAVSVTAKSCDPAAGQVALYTGTGFTGDCAVYDPGAYPNVANGGAGIPHNTAESIKLGTGAFAVLHGVPGFGGTFNDAWVNVAADDANLTDKVYKVPSSENGAVNAFQSVSGIWVMGTGCTPGPNQVSLFALPGYGGGCVNVGAGTYDVVTQGIPNDWVSSLKVGRAAKATLYRDIGQAGPTCTYDAFAQDPSVCDSAFGQQNLSSMTVTALAKTSATLTFTSAQAAPDGTVVIGSVHGAPATTFTLSFYSGAACPDDTNGKLLGTTTVQSNAAGDGSFNLKVAGTVQVGDPVGTTARQPFFAPTDPACVNATPFDTNTFWTTAEQIPLSSGTFGDGSVGNEGINVSGEARWYKVNVTPGGTIQVDLSNLPANYDLALFSDIGQSYNDITAPGGLQQVNAELGAQFSPTIFTPTIFTPTIFTPTIFTPTIFTPTIFTGDETAFESAQYRSLYGISVNDGTANEHIFANVFGNTGSFYVRVTGRNGAYLPSASYTLSVHETPGACSGVSPNGNDPLPGSVPTGVQTLILTDYTRMSGNLTTLKSKVGALATASTGSVVDLSTASPVVAALNAQADAAGNLGCPYAKNLVAGAIKKIVDKYRAANPGLKYIVIVGDDHIIPFFRYADTAGLGPEQNYVPPVLLTSASEASLQNNLVLGQDEYGSSTVLHLKGQDLALPGLPVGRLVESPSDIVTMINAYLGLTGGVVPTPRSSLVTGYDFMASGANAVESNFAAGLGAGATNDTLISPQGTPPSQSWTADQLRTALLAKRHDLIYIGGHFSANNTLAGDYATTMNSTELAASNVNLTNAIVFTGGCHSGYNIVSGDAVPNVTQPLDWTQAFAQHGATLIAGTGYQYGDTDFLAYSQLLYSDFSLQLRYGTGPVSVGNALVQAKKMYLSNSQNLTGVDAKAVIESTLYGLPMLSVNLPAGRLTPPGSTSLVATTTKATTKPGSLLGLSWFDYTTSPTLTTKTANLSDGTNSVTATWFVGRDGVVTSPTLPTLPLQQDDVTDLDPADSGSVLRGVGFRGGSFTDQSGVTPLTGTPATEQNGAHTPFVSSIFFPGKIWSVNYFGGLTGSLTGGLATTQLMLTPAQYRSDSSGNPTDIQRKYSSVSLRLFYSGYTGSSGLAAPPTIARVDAALNGTTVTFKVHVVGDPNAGIQQVWVTYAGVTAGTWQSLDLAQDTTDSTLWTGSLNLGAVDPSALRFVAQAANGVGLVTLDDNHGTYYQLGGIAPALQTPLTATTLGLNAPVPATGPYGSTVSVAATLQANGSPLANAAVRFVIGSSTRSATTNASGVASVSVPLVDNPGRYDLTAAFDGDAAKKSSAASSVFDITKLATGLSLTQNGYVVAGLDTGVVATLTSGGQPVSQKSVAFLFTPTGGGSTFAQTRITDGSGRASLGPVSTLPAGAYTVQAYFGPGGPAGVPALPADPVYASSSSSPVVPLTVNALNGSGLAGLTVFYVQSSAKYLASNQAQRLAITVTVTALSNTFLVPIKPGLPAPAKAALVAAYKAQLLLLQAGGWLTSAQATQLSALASQL